MIIVQVWGKVNYRIWADEALFDIDSVPEDDCDVIALSFHTLRQSWPHVVHSAIYNDSVMECTATDIDGMRIYSKEETEKIINSPNAKQRKREWEDKERKLTLAENMAIGREESNKRIEKLAE